MTKRIITAIVLGGIAIFGYVVGYNVSMTAIDIYFKPEKQGKIAKFIENKFLKD